MKAKRNNVELEYQDFGSGPAVLFIHDCPSGRELPDDLFRTMGEAGYRVILSRLRGPDKGAGKNFDPAPHTRESISLLNYLGIGRAVVIGIGLGGYVLLDLLEKFPRRVAASTLVVDPGTAKDIRKLTKSSKVKTALEEGRFDEFKKAILTALPPWREERPACSAFRQLRAWVDLACRRLLPAAADRRNRSAWLDVKFPPLFVAGDSAYSLLPIPERNRSVTSRGWKKIKGLNAHFLALLNFLVPEDDEDGEEILTDLG